MDTARHGRDHLILKNPTPGGQFAPGGGAPPSKGPVDFGDVFGGPPRRLSGNADGAGAGAGAGRVGGVGEGGRSSRRWSASVAEKPVFGEFGVGSPAQRRRHLGDDFFSDIFRGDESAPCPTPRRRDRDLFPPASPASRALSPALSLPPARDVFGGVSAVPAHISYSSRLAKSFDYSSFRSPPSFAVCQQEENAPYVFSVPSTPIVCAPASARQTDKLLKKVTAGSKAYTGRGHFQFSIYKWASRGVAHIMPSSFKERTKGGSRLGAVSSQIWHREDLPLDNEGMFQGIHSFHNQNEVEHNSPFDDLASSRTGYTGSSNEVTETLPAASDKKADTSGSHARETKGSLEEEGKPRLKNLNVLIDENSDGEGDGVTRTRQTREKGGLASEDKSVRKDGESTKKVKQENRKNTIFDCGETSSHERHCASKILEEKVLPARDNRRVNDYVKTFNQEATEKTSDPVKTQTRGPKVKEKLEDCTNANSDQQDNGNYVEASSIPLCAGQSMKEEREATIKGSSVEKVGGSYTERINASGPLSGSTPDSFDASFCNMEVHNKNINDCLVGELSQDHTEVTETDLHQEENKTKMSDTTIQEWSNGREGNIRSLLSTLQYVLWPGCGWKTVPLVDIIESASVRRAYQKALLCLHPDKLQQKGVETHQKYIAEKVFDILQEAWDHFNSLSSL